MFWFNDKPDFVQEAHNRGQEDASEGKYDNVYEHPVDAILGGPYDPERADAYDDGHKNGSQ